MKGVVTRFIERMGLTMGWRVRRSFLIWLLTPIFLVGALLCVLLMLNPQTGRVIYIFQAMVTQRGGDHPWGESGPRPPSDYTGVWHRWHWNGRLSFEEHYEAG